MVSGSFVNGLSGMMSLTRQRRKPQSVNMPFGSKDVIEAKPSEGQKSEAGFAASPASGYVRVLTTVILDFYLRQANYATCIDCEQNYLTAA